MKTDLTVKQEKFCQLYIELGNASEAYRQAYDSANMADATINRKAKELTDNGKIGARLGELRTEHLDRHSVTVDSLIAELENARQLAKQAMNASAMVSATMGKAKILGFDKQMHEVSGNVRVSKPSTIKVVFEDAKEMSDDELASIDNST